MFERHPGADRLCLYYRGNQRLAEIPIIWREAIHELPDSIEVEMQIDPEQHKVVNLSPPIVDFGVTPDEAQFVRADGHVDIIATAPRVDLRALDLREGDQVIRFIWWPPKVPEKRVIAVKLSPEHSDLRIDATRLDLVIETAKKSKHKDVHFMFRVVGQHGGGALAEVDSSNLAPSGPGEWKDASTRTLQMPLNKGMTPRNRGNFALKMDYMCDHNGDPQWRGKITGVVHWSDGSNSTVFQTGEFEMGDYGIHTNAIDHGRVHQLFGFTQPR
jgi:hypothetical protein